MEYQVDVCYFDSVQGGAGSARMNFSEVPEWLVVRPGVLIREIVPVTSLPVIESYRRARDNRPIPQ